MRRRNNQVRHDYFCDITPEIQNLLDNEWEDAVERAQDVFDMFHEYENEELKFICYEWPDPEDQILLGIGNRIGYRSDKFPDADGKTSWRDYIHAHSETLNPRPRIIMKRPRPEDCDENDIVLVDQPRLSNPLEMPYPPVFSICGFALDYEFIRDGQISNVDWKLNPEKGLPFLASNEDGTILLVLYPDTGHPVYIIDGPCMRITARGLEN